MRKVLNVKLVGWLMVAPVLLGAGVHFLHGYQVKRNASVLVSQASRAEGQGQIERAAECLQRYLGLVPSDTDVLARYGLTLNKLATSRKGRLRAFLALQQVLVREPQRQDIRRHLVRLATSLGRFTDAREHLEILLKSSSDDAELEQLLGQSEEANGQYSKAAAWFQKAIEHAPDQIDSYVRRAHLLRHR